MLLTTVSTHHTSLMLRSRSSLKAKASRTSRVHLDKTQKGKTLREKWGKYPERLRRKGVSLCIKVSKYMSEWGMKAWVLKASLWASHFMSIRWAHLYFTRGEAGNYGIELSLCRHACSIRIALKCKTSAWRNFGDDLTVIQGDTRDKDRFYMNITQLLFEDNQYIQYEIKANVMSFEINKSNSISGVHSPTCEF